LYLFVIKLNRWTGLKKHMLIAMRHSNMIHRMWRYNSCFFWIGNAWFYCWIFIWMKGASFESLLRFLKYPYMGLYSWSQCFENFLPQTHLLMETCKECGDHNNASVQCRNLSLLLLPCTKKLERSREVLGVDYSQVRKAYSLCPTR
jgi:hypothetical protein